MAKWRKRPVVIEAVQWDETTRMLLELEAAGMQPMSHRGHRDFPDQCLDLRIRTLEGELMVRPGDWIIKGVKGEFYPCRADIFAVTYEIANPVEPIDSTAKRVAALEAVAEAALALWRKLPDEWMYGPYGRHLEIQIDALAALRELK